MAAKTNPESDAITVAHWLGVVEDCVDVCADYRDSSPDIFLWKARGVAEAVLEAFAVGTEYSDRLRDVGRGSPIKHEEVARNLAKERRVHELLPELLGLVRRAGNVGAHAQGPTRQIDLTMVRSCSDSLCSVVVWLYGQSTLRRPMPLPLQRAITDLRGAGRLSPEQRVSEALNAAKVRIGELERALSTPSGVVPVIRPPSARGKWIAVGLLLLVVGFVLGRLGGSSPPVEASAAAAPGEATESNVALVLTAPDAAVAAPAADASAAPDSSAPPPLAFDPTACPKGTLAVPGATLHLTGGPYPRSGWRKPPGDPVPTTVAGFCLDNDPMAAGAKWSEAEAACAADGARLPSVAEWEVAARAHRKKKFGDQWSADPFPNPVFGYRPQACADPCPHLYFKGRVTDPRKGTPKLSWNQYDDTKPRLQNVSFRCVRPARSR